MVTHTVSYAMFTITVLRRNRMLPMITKKAVPVKEFPAGYEPSTTEIIERIHSQHRYDVRSVVYLLELLSLSNKDLTYSTALWALARSLKEEK